MSPQELFGWIVIYTVCFTLLVLTLRESQMRKAGK